MSIFDRILKRRLFYRSVFRPGRDTDAVLADLKRFCRGMSSPCVVSNVSGSVDPMATGIAIGRQEVWLRIISHLNLDDSQLINMKEVADDDNG